MDGNAAFTALLYKSRDNSKVGITKTQGGRFRPFSTSSAGDAASMFGLPSSLAEGSVNVDLFTDSPLLVGTGISLWSILIQLGGTCPQVGCSAVYIRAISPLT